MFRGAFPMIEPGFPARALRDHALARWARQHDIAVDVRTSEELGIAIANGIQPARIIAHGDALCETELRCATNLGVGRMIVGTLAQIAFLGACTARVQAVLVRMTDPSAPNGAPEFGFPVFTPAADTAIGAVLGQHQLTLAGLHVKVGPDEHACISYPAAVGKMIAEMDQIWHQHGMVLRGLGLDCEVWDGDRDAGLRQLAAGIDETVAQACANLRFPRPGILLSTGSTALSPVQA